MIQAKPAAWNDPSSTVTCIHCGEGVDLTALGVWKQLADRAIVTCPDCWGEMEARGWYPKMTLTKR